MPLPSDEALIFDAVMDKLKGAIAARVAKQCDQSGCASSWAAREEMAGLSEAEQGHRQKALAGYKADLERLRADEERCWAALKKVALGK